MRHYLILLICLLCFGGVSAQEDLSPYEIALQRIQEAERTGASRLDLSGLILEELPPEIGRLTNLQYLDLYGNYLSNFPPEIGKLTNLKYLNLHLNHLSSLSPEIGKLTNLEELGLNDNLLTSLPSEIGNLRNLQALYVGNNQLSNLPPEIGELVSLRTLNLRANHLNNLPSEMGKLRSLCFLNLEDNQLHHLPIELGQINQFTEESTCSKSSLISGIFLYGNPLISPPQAVIDAGTPAILDYLRNEAWWHLQRLIIGASSSVGFFVVLILGLRWRNQRGKVKRKVK